MTIRAFPPHEGKVHLLCDRWGYRGRRRPTLPAYCRAQPKPAWVTREIVRMTACGKAETCGGRSDGTPTIKSYKSLIFINKMYLP